jgi:hypothetical protein
MLSELFDPSLMRFDWLDGASHVGSLATATLLADGDILIVGGQIGELDAVRDARLFHAGPATTP